MCVSIVFAVNLNDANLKLFEEKIHQLGNVYQYGIGVGETKLLPAAGPLISVLFSEPHVIFEVHDMPETHCACDIDQDIRNGSRNNTKSSFFDFVRELKELNSVRTMSVLFFQEELPNDNNVRKQSGNFDKFVNLLNRWNTWQVEGFEPTRQAYFVVDSSPLMFTFTE